MRRQLSLLTLISVVSVCTLVALTTAGSRVALGMTPASDVLYFFDELGRLVGVVDGNGEAARYYYDGVGNLLSISRWNSSTVAIVVFNPSKGAIGDTVTIFGTGFSTTPSQNTVTFNGTAATVTSSTPNQIVTAVPAGATTGPVAVTSPAGSVTSATQF
ncbi:MAG TPA: IPT/TIG domain-containing protein, partial [Blastocatellia bacterium]|nr:IPT/TIG domain-containing protein [Blastocatellia bacterium]